MKTPWKTGNLTSWLASTGRPVKYIYRDDNESAYSRIAVFGGNGEEGDQEYDCEEDAETIVACVNACANRNPAALSELEAAVEAVIATAPKEEPDRDDYDMSKDGWQYGAALEAYLTARKLRSALAAWKGVQ